MTDESIFREVDEEVRQEEYQKIWAKHGRSIMALAAVIVIGVAGYQGYHYYQQKQSEEAAVVYFDAVQKATDGKIDDALAALKAVTHSGYLQLAKVKEATLLGEKGETDKAVAAYDAIAADAGIDGSLRNLARVRAGYLLVDREAPDALLKRLGEFDKDGNVWRHAAREVFGLAAWRTKDFTMADRYMKAIFDDPTAPAAMRERAQLMIQLIAPYLPQE